MGIIFRVMIMILISITLFIFGFIKSIKLLKYFGIILFTISVVGLFVIWMVLGSI